jgi:hypothetical protein
MYSHVKRPRYLKFRNMLCVCLCSYILHIKRIDDLKNLCVLRIFSRYFYDRHTQFVKSSLFHIL